MRFPATSPRWLYFFIPGFLMDGAIYTATLAAPLVALRQFSATSAQLGWLGAAAAAGYALMALIAGALSDRGGRRRWIKAGALVQIVCMVALIFAPTLHLFLALAILQSTLLGLFWAPLLGILSETASPGRLSRELGVFNLSWSAGGGCGALIGAWAISHFGERAPFWISAIIIAVVLAIVSGPPPRDARVPGDAAPAPHPRATPLKHLAWVAMSAAFFVASLTIYLFPARAEKPPLSLSPSQLMALQAVRMGAMFATFGVMGRLSGWHFRRLPFHLMFLGLLVSLGLLAFNMSWGAYALCFAVFGCAASIGYVLSAYYSMLSPHRKGGMLGIHEALLSGGSMLGPLFGSQMIQMTGGNLHAPYSWSLLPLALTWLVCFIFLRRLPAR